MGSVTAIGLADTTLDLETQLKYHLQGNHYPPIPTVMVQPCIEAIDAYYEDNLALRLLTHTMRRITLAE